MTTIILHAEIKAPIEKVFDLSRSIDLHMRSASKTKERAISGRTTGLIGPDETVTWRGKHFGVFLEHTSKIISYEHPVKFTDIMIKGHFTYFTHQHLFREKGDITVMTDIMKYKVPLGWIGKWFDRFLLKDHMTQFLNLRNKTIKDEAEQASNSEEYKHHESAIF